ncbi:hypothetical protein [Cronobacter sakazakii]|uniref:hypothetical protein n=1 Tax=Cronobacter sakazakii TaxID=28141 RepID=UPI000B2C9D35|nr:hypothetical protein [Cronobacter sakazakii]ELY3709270.1 hypothetical protein [Cronobacter sakazakii]ELY4091069.1 hypothetical protein [Cronobacter sakazakii]ELY4661252.1 hypothetical protein [Cronobacter sakazakii]ELY5847184.1 hypothetical protein [Cronobacter sakazakii]ELY5859510.1 hypothetical protein [Cronobacter sakazakii]
MTNEYEYAERFADLMEDMHGDGEEDKGLIWQLEDKELVITIEPVDGTNTARLH